MKASSLLCGIFCCFLIENAFAREISVPQKWGVYMVDVDKGNVRLMGEFQDWSFSPNGRFIVGEREAGTPHPFYEVAVVPTSGGTTRKLERFSIDEPSGASFHWSSDSARVRVEADRNDDGKNESKTYTIGRATEGVRTQGHQRTLSVLARRRLKARYAKISDIAFSPDGKRVVAYLSRSSYERRDFDGGLWMFTPDGKNLKRLTRNQPLPHDLWDVEPHWLPDGKRLAFERTSFEDEGI